MTASTQVTPARLMQIAWGFAPGLIIEAAVETGVFDALAKKPMTIAETAREIGASNRGLTSLMNALVGLQLLERDESARFRPTDESIAFLVGSSPSSLARFFNHISTHLMPSWSKLADSVRSGRPYQATDHEDVGSEFFKGFVESLFAVNYPAATLLGKHLGLSLVDRPTGVLDIATGSGVWGIALAKQSPHVRVTAVDWPAVLPVAVGMVEQHGLSSRFKFVAGDILAADFGGNHDIAVLGHILHSEGEERSKALLKRVHDALNPGGTIAVAEFVVNEDRSGPVPSLIFDLTMFVSTQHGVTWSYQELRGLLEEAGFDQVTKMDAPGPAPLVLATRRH